ncbi:hypothetical protein [Bacillus alkalicellulosilyticus]|uniref:hypothetical protein n=1 Tax=Alkalihalobacterium alkalicellulosilyticum TaxID=1912214 RepID=UPI0009984593|nr:hypothetical protein [Bacillus alkalicellulosilyticus]
MFIKRNYIFLFLLFLTLTSGCQATTDELLEASTIAFSDSFTATYPEPNVEAEQVSYYTSEAVGVRDETEYNLILEKDEQLFLLFFNPVEELDSTLNLQRDMEAEQEPLLLETYEGTEKQAYLIISEENEDEFKVIAGIGGAKVSTITVNSNLEESVTVMMEVLHSLSYN